MTKQSIPSDPKKDDPKPIEVPKDVKSMEESLAKFQEALKSDEFKDFDVYKALDIEKPVDKVEEPTINQAKIDELLPKYEALKSEIIEAGHKFESETKMSEADKIISARLEKQGQVKLSEQKAELLKLDKDFPVEVIEKLDLPTEEKLSVMGVLKEITTRNTDGLATIKKTLDDSVGELQEAKLRAPEEEKKDETGNDKVNDAITKMGASSLEQDEPSVKEGEGKSKEDKTDTK